MSDSVSVEDRLEALEDHNHVLQRSIYLLSALVIVMAVTMFILGRSSASAVNTEALFLTDQGRSRSVLTPMPTGHLGLAFCDIQGNLPQNLQFGAIPYLDGIAIYDKAGIPRILIGINEQNEPVIVAVSPEGKTLFEAVPRSAARKSSDAPQQGEGKPAAPAASATPAPSATP